LTWIVPVKLQERGEQFHDVLASLGPVIIMHGRSVIVAEDRDFKFQDADASFTFLPGLHILHSHPCHTFVAQEALGQPSLRARCDSCRIILAGCVASCRSLLQHKLAFRLCLLVQSLEAYAPVHAQALEPFLRSDAWRSADRDPSLILYAVRVLLHLTDSVHENIQL
jgi:hypothetical protein